MERMLTPLYLMAPPCAGTMEGFPGALISLKNYLDCRFGGDNPSTIIDLGGEGTEGVGERIRREIPGEGKIIVGITVSTATYRDAIQIAEEAKRRNPSAIVVLGGHHVKKASKQAEVVLKEHGGVVDYVCLGDGEKTLEALMAGKRGWEVPNAAFVSAGGVCQGPFQELSEEELGMVPFRAYPTESKLGKFDEDVSYVSSRGCGNRCSFCAVGGERVRAKGVDAIMRDLREIVGKGIRMVSFEDNFFSHNMGKVVELVRRMIREKDADRDFAFTWSCQTRLDAIPGGGDSAEGLIGLLYAAGARRIYAGVENFDQNTLREMGKAGDTAKYVMDALENGKLVLSRPGMELGLLFIMGRPSENAETERINYECLEEFGRIASGLPGSLVVYPSLSVVYPGTADLERLLRMAGHLSWDTIFEEYTRWEKENKIEFIEKNFAHGTGGIPWGMLDVEELKKRVFRLDEEKVERIRSYHGRIKELEKKPFCRIRIHGYGGNLQKVKPKVHA